MHEAEGWGTLVVDQAGAENEGEKPEDDDEQDLNHRDQDEQDDIDRD